MTGSGKPVGSAPGEMAPAFYRVVCSCGAKLRVRGAKPGGSCLCPRCRVRHVIPAVTPPHRSASDTAVEKPQLDTLTCSVCYTGIAAGEQRQTCPACSLNFHADCWQENLGCSAYGCSQVNALKKGPDLQIPSSIHTEYAEEVILDALPADEYRPKFPWQVVFLVLSIIGGLFGLVTFGVPSLLVGAAALFYTVAASERRQLSCLVLALIVSVVAFLTGMIVSARIYTL